MSEEIHTKPAIPAPPLKEGYKTTEFWLSGAASVLSLLALVGVVGPAEQQTLQDGISLVAEGVKQIILGVTTIAPIVAYVWSRTATKVESIIRH